MMTTSPEPEETHKHYWMTGLTLPVDDPFWSKHYPGDRWNCKCSLESTDGPVVRPNDIPEEPRIPGLDTNPGKDGCTFSCSHPYFPKDCAHCFAKKAVNGAPSIKNALRHLLIDASNHKQCDDCHYIDKKTLAAIKEGGITGELAKLTLADGKEYGRLLRKIIKMKDFKPIPGEKDIFYTGGEKSKDFEPLVNAARKAVSFGYKVYMLPNPGGIRTADFIFVRKNNVKMLDLKTISGKNSVGNRLQESIGQVRRVVLNITTDYNPRHMAMDINDYFESNPVAVEVLIFKGNKKISVSREDLGKDFVKIFIRRYVK